MNNLRHFERFTLNLPARAEAIISKKKQLFDLKIHDISSSGAFLYTLKPFPKGTILKLNLALPNARIRKLTGAESFIECEGTVVRSTQSGVGIHFNKGCRISSLIGL